MTTPILLNCQLQHEDCFIYIHGGLPKGRNPSHPSDQEERRDPGQEYHQVKTQLHLTGVGDFLVTCVEDAHTQYHLGDLPNSHRADTGSLIQVNKSACDNGPVCFPMQVGIVYPPQQIGNRFL